MYDTSLQPIEMQERYKELPVEITELFEYDTVGVVINKIAVAFGLNEDQVTALKMEIEMVLYLFMTREGFAERLQDSMEIDKERATGIAQVVSSDLFVIVESTLNIADDERRKNEIIALKVENETVAPTATNANQGVILEVQNQTPTPAQEIKPIRTFTEDVNLNRAHGYGAFRSTETQAPTDDEITHRSSQDDIIKR